MIKKDIKNGDMLFVRVIHTWASHLSFQFRAVQRYKDS